MVCSSNIFLKNKTKENCKHTAKKVFLRQRQKKKKKGIVFPLPFCITEQASGVYRPFFGVFRVRIPSFFPFFLGGFVGILRWFFQIKL